MEIANSLFGGLISSAPLLIGWIVALVLAAVMLGRGGGRAERFLVAGLSLMLVHSLFGIFVPFLSIWLTAAGDMTNVAAASILGIYGLVRGVIGLAGIILLILAFWNKFKSSR